MLYYKVIPYADGLSAGLKTKTKLIAGELYTEKETIRLGMTARAKNNYTIPVRIPKNETYFFFGARFESSKQANKTVAWR